MWPRQERKRRAFCWCQAGTFCHSPTFAPCFLSPGRSIDWIGKSLSMKKFASFSGTWPGDRVREIHRWAMARHFHYAPEISAAFFWTVPALISHVSISMLALLGLIWQYAWTGETLRVREVTAGVTGRVCSSDFWILLNDRLQCFPNFDWCSFVLQPLPYFYVFFLTILLVDRAERDDKRCQAKWVLLLYFWAISSLPQQFRNVCKNFLTTQMLSACDPDADWLC